MCLPMRVCLCIWSCSEFLSLCDLAVASQGHSHKSSHFPICVGQGGVRGTGDRRSAWPRVDRFMEHRVSIMPWAPVHQSLTYTLWHLNLYVHQCWHLHTHQYMKMFIYTYREWELGAFTNSKWQKKSHHIRSVCIYRWFFHNEELCS